MKLILQSDQELSKPYNETKKKNDIDVMFSFLNKYNQNNKDDVEEITTAKLTIIRRSKKEADQPLVISINGNEIGNLIQDDLIRTELLSPIGVEICANKNCFKFSLTTENENYIQCSWSKKSNEITVEPLPSVEGEFYMDKVKYLKEKREEEGN